VTNVGFLRVGASSFARARLGSKKARREEIRVPGLFSGNAGRIVSCESLLCQ
jgi:hypothetical protein